MSNVNSPFGFSAIRRIDGGIVGRFGYDYTIADALAQNIGYGNLVSRTGTGKNIQNAVDGVAGATIVGVAAGFKWRDAFGNIFYRPNWVSGTVTFNNEGGQVVVIDDPKVVFLAQMSGDFQAADSGQFAGLVLAAPNALGVSQWQVNSSDITGTLDSVKILGLSNPPRAQASSGRNDYGTNAKVEVLLAFHEYGDGTLRAS